MESADLRDGDDPTTWRGFDDSGLGTVVADLRGDSRTARPVPAALPGPEELEGDTVYAVMERYFTSPVASTGIVAGLVPVGARVEIDVIAVAPS
jgi:hypothetical protein